MNPRGHFPESEARRIVRARSGGLCEKDGRNEAIHWHHRLNRSQGGTWHPSNGLHLCLECHLEMDGADEELFTNGWRISGKDKRPYTKIPVKHWLYGLMLLDDRGDFHYPPPPVKAAA